MSFAWMTVSEHAEQKTPAALARIVPTVVIVLRATVQPRGCVVTLPVSRTALWPSRVKLESSTVHAREPLVTCTPPPLSNSNEQFRTCTARAPEISRAASDGTPALDGSMLNPFWKPSCA